MVEMVIAGIGRLEEGGLVAVLRERGGLRTMGVGLGEIAATGVSAHLARLPATRPNPHALSLQVMDRMGARLLRVTVDDNGAAEPAGYLEVDAPAGVCEVGCAPEDAVVLAAYAGVAVMVHPELLRPDAPHLGPGPGAPKPRPRRGAKPDPESPGTQG